MTNKSSASETPIRRGRRPKQQPTAPAPRTKEAVIELFCDESTICLAYDAAQYDAFMAKHWDTPKNELRVDATDPEWPEPVFEGYSQLGMDSMDDDPTLTVNPDPTTKPAEWTQLEFKEEQEATLIVLGWLWRHGYKSARWGSRLNDCPHPDGRERPDWATKDVYKWGPSTEL